MTVIANLEARYSANIISFDRELKRMQTLNARAADRIANDHKKSVRDVNSAWGKADIGGALNKSLGNGLGSLRTQLMGSIAAITSGAGIAAAVGLADTYNRFTNSLKVAGVEGGNLKVVQDALFESANRNGVAVESLGQLYGRVSQASKELGVSQTQVLQVTDAVSAAIRISGQPISAASGAMLQMAQAMGSGVVRAEEFNSMLEGMFPLIQAAANASEQYGGSVAKMRADVLAGKLTSKEFFDLILAGSASLEAQAANAPLTVAQSYEALRNNLIQAMGATNEAWGITDRLSEALAWLANNLDKVGTALGVIALALSVAAAPAIGRAAIAMGTFTASTIAAGAATLGSIPGVIGLTAGLNGITPAAAAATLAMRTLMSATGIGIAIMAIAGAVTFFAAKSYQAAEASRQLRDRVNQKAEAYRAAKAASDQARVNTGSLTKAELEAATAAAALTGENGKLESSYYRIAAAAKAAELAQLRANVAESRKDADTAGRAYMDRLDAEERRLSNAERQAGRAMPVERGLGVDVPLSRGQARDISGRARSNVNGTEVGRTRANSWSVYQADEQALREAEARRLEFYAPRATGGGGGGGGGGGSSGTSAADRQRNSDDALARAERELRDAARAQAATASERHAVAIAALADDRDVAILAIRRRVTDGEITAATGEKLEAIQAEIYSAKVSAEADRRAAELRDAEAALQQLRNDNLIEAARLDADELDDMARNASTMAERHDYERQSLEAKQRADRMMFDAEQAAYRLQLQKNELDQAEIDRLIAEREANFNRGQSGERNAQNQSQDRENGPSNIREWINEFTNATAAGETLNQKLFSIAEGGINSLTDSLMEAIQGTKSFGEAFKDMAMGIVAQLIKLAIQFVVFEMLGRAFGIPGLGRVAIGLQASASDKAVGKNAMGTNFWGGGLTMVGEKGPELVNLQRGAGVIPNSELRNAMRVSPVAGRGGQTINLTTVVHADNAVMRDEINLEIAKANIATLSQAKRMSDAQAMRGRNVLR